MAAAAGRGGSDIADSPPGGSFERPQLQHVRVNNPTKGGTSTSKEYRSWLFRSSNGWHLVLGQREGERKEVLVTQACQALMPVGRAASGEARLRIALAKHIRPAPDQAWSLLYANVRSIGAHQGRPQTEPTGRSIRWGSRQRDVVCLRKLIDGLRALGSTAVSPADINELKLALASEPSRSSEEASFKGPSGAGSEGSVPLDAPAPRAPAAPLSPALTCPCAPLQPASEPVPEPMVEPPPVRTQQPRAHSPPAPNTLPVTIAAANGRANDDNHAVISSYTATDSTLPTSAAALLDKAVPATANTTRLTTEKVVRLAPKHSVLPTRCGTGTGGPRSTLMARANVTAAAAALAQPPLQPLQHAAAPAGTVSNVGIAAASDGVASGAIPHHHAVANMIPVGDKHGFRSARPPACHVPGDVYDVATTAANTVAAAATMADNPVTVTAGNDVTTAAANLITITGTNSVAATVAEAVTEGAPASTAPASANYAASLLDDATGTSIPVQELQLAHTVGLVLGRAR